MNKKRIGRISTEIQKVMSHAIDYEMKDPRIAKMTSVTDVTVSADLSYCDIYFSVLGEEWDKKQTLEGLESATGFLKNEIAQNIDIRKIPELRFHLDNSIEHGLYMDQLINKTLEEDRQSQIERGDIDPDEELDDEEEGDE